MKDIILCILFLIISYLLGSIPFGLLLSKAHGIDLRTKGSGNIGSTNAFRVLGVKLGLFAALFDVAKGSVIILLVRLLIDLGAYNNPLFNDSNFFYIIYGLPAVIGHCFSVYLKFKGGKGVATSLGVALASYPLLALLIMTVFIIVVIITKYVSLASTIAAITTTTFAFIFFPLYYHDFIIPIGILLMTILIMIQHIPNYKRLINHNENKIF